MDALNAREVTRRTMLKHAGVTAGLGALVAVASFSIDGRPAAAASALPSAASPDAISRYVSAAGADGFTDLAGVHAEYRAAVDIFPFELPSGVSFPPISGYRDAEPVAAWERGNGTAEAYFFWHNSMVGAARDAYLRGDTGEASRLLDALDAAYSSPVRTSMWEDPAGTFAPALSQARSGTYDGLLQLTR
jgi:hypothetical protein